MRCLVLSRENFRGLGLHSDSPTISCLILAKVINCSRLSLLICKMGSIMVPVKLL